MDDKAMLPVKHISLRSYSRNQSPPLFNYQTPCYPLFIDTSVFWLWYLRILMKFISSRRLFCISSQGSPCGRNVALKMLISFHPRIFDAVKVCSASFNILVTYLCYSLSVTSKHVTRTTVTHTSVTGTFHWRSPKPPRYRPLRRGVSRVGKLQRVPVSLYGAHIMDSLLCRYSNPSHLFWDHVFISTRIFGIMFMLVCWSTNSIDGIDTNFFNNTVPILDIAIEETWDPWALARLRMKSYSACDAIRRYREVQFWYR